MTDEEDVIDGKDDQEDENEDIELLNEAYDRVSGSGEMPSIDDFFGREDTGDPFSNDIYDDGIGREVGDPEISDDPVVDESDQNSEVEEETETKFGLKSILDGSFISNEKFHSYFKFFLFLVGLAIAYITIRNNAEAIIRKNLLLQREVRELRAESIIISAQLMSISKETEVAKRVETKKLGLHEQKEPPMIFFIEKFERADSLKSKEPVVKRKYTNDFNEFEDDYKKIR
ncbi:MAG: hypothetical protein IKQ46_16785 [Bacteroidales bacterium]|jgi:hypothetical protein|nr:hypothetical protein [Bacteroidales bacterium]